jgi:hypothetical protein
MIMIAVILGMALVVAARAEDGSSGVSTPAVATNGTVGAVGPGFGVMTNTELIKLYYERYKGDEKLLKPYLEALGDGFKMGVQGEPASLLGPHQELTPAAAGINGFVYGYLHGRELYRSLSGNQDGDTIPKPL